MLPPTPKTQPHTNNRSVTGADFEPLPYTCFDLTLEQTAMYPITTNTIRIHFTVLYAYVRPICFHMFVINRLTVGHRSGSGNRKPDRLISLKIRWSVCLMYANQYFSPSLLFRNQITHKISHELESKFCLSFSFIAVQIYLFFYLYHGRSRQMLDPITNSLTRLTFSARCRVSTSPAQESAANLTISSPVIGWVRRVFPSKCCCIGF